MRFISVGFLLIALVLCFVVASAVRDVRIGTIDARGLLLDQVDQPLAAEGQPRRFVVHQGESAAMIADRLEREGLIRSSWSVQIMTRINENGSDLKAGEYELSPTMRPSDMLAIIREGRYDGAVLTIPEGWRLAEVADAVAKAGIGRRDEFLEYVSRAGANRDFLRDRPAEASLEGYLFPDTYRVPTGTTVASLTEEMLDTFGRRVTPDLRARAAERGLTLHQVVTLASIVEREARVPAERTEVAAVFHNRLKRNMPLQADPTVQYALWPGLSPVPPNGDYWKVGLTRADLQVESPYNTYRRNGLIPGPICNPGLATIQAVIEAPPTENLFFVAKPDGSHAFAKTLAEHEANVARYQLSPTSSPR